MNLDAHAQGRGNCIDRDVVVGRSDAAGGEEIIVPRAQMVHCIGNRLHVVGDYPHFLEPDALHAQPGGDLGDILVMGATGKNLVADDDQGCGIDAGFGHGRGVRAERGLRQASPLPQA